MHSVTISMQKTLLVVGYVWPEPRSSAAGTRLIQLMRWALGAEFAVTFVSAAEPGAAAADLAALGVSSQSVLLNCESFDHFVAALQPTVVIFDRFLVEEQFGWRVKQVCPQAIRILDSEDLHCLRDARERAHTLGQAVLEPSNSLLFGALALREIAAIYRCDLTLIISDAEMLMLRERFGVPAFLLHHCPFMFDPPNVTEWLGFEQRQHFVFIGNYLHAPNWDAVRHLRELWPGIRQRLPQAELHLYGAYPPKKAMQLDNPAIGFRVLGWAQDALAVLGQARVCLAPLRFGAGIKGKLAEAMSCGTPSVTNAIGAEGMTALGTLPWPGSLAENAEDFMAAAVALYGDAADWQAAQLRGLATFEHLFSRVHVEAQLSARLGSIEAGLDAHRCANFMGAMLAQQQYKSTEFMSRWIEVKTQLRQLEQPGDIL